MLKRKHRICAGKFINTEFVLETSPERGRRVTIVRAVRCWHVEVLTGREESFNVRLEFLWLMDEVVYEEEM